MASSACELIHTIWSASPLLVPSALSRRAVGAAAAPAVSAIHPTRTRARTQFPTPLRLGLAESPARALSTLPLSVARELMTMNKPNSAADATVSEITQAR